MFVSACLQSQCTDDNLSPSPNSPPGILIFTGNVNSRSTSTFSVDGSSVCNNNNDAKNENEPCVFIVSLYPPQGCISSTCAALFTISASITAPSPPISPSPSPQSSPIPPPSPSALPPSGPGNNNARNNDLDDILAGVFLGGGVLLCASVYLILRILRSGLPCRKQKRDQPRDGGGLLILREKHPDDEDDNDGDYNNEDEDIEGGRGHYVKTTASTIISSIMSSRSSSGANSKTTSPVLIAQRRDMREERIRQLRGSLDIQTSPPFVNATAAGRPISPLLLS
jgi:hypothetical protein